MSHELFRDVVSPGVRVQSQSRVTILISVVAHVLIVAAVVIVPLMASGAMPLPAAGDLSFMMVAPPPGPPPLPTPPVPKATATPVVNSDAAPTVMPKDIGDELPPTVVGDNTAVGAIDHFGSPQAGFGGDPVGLKIEAPAPPPAPVQPSKPVRPGGDIREPVKVKHVPPMYPRIAIDARIQGRVVIDAVIGTDGVVREARILSGVPMLNQAALDAVKQWRYTPTMLNNVPVPVIMTVTVQFNLQQ